MTDLEETAAGGGLLIATFIIGEARFGIDAGKILEVVQTRKTTVIHHAPRFVVGVMNLRGRVVTVIDLGEKLDVGAVVSSVDNRILIVEWKHEFVGLLVDRVIEVLSAERNSIEKPPENIHGIQTSLITGVLQDDSGRLTALLDINHVLDTEEDKR